MSGSCFRTLAVIHSVKIVRIFSLLNLEFCFCYFCVVFAVKANGGINPGNPLVNHGSYNTNHGDNHTKHGNYNTNHGNPQPVIQHEDDTLYLSPLPGATLAELGTSAPAFCCCCFVVVVVLLLLFFCFYRIR